ncbi:MAG: hypothetical protein PUI16_02605 [Clostridia bacterium]|nr:hypothetical protein [Clostridia bacterium]MDY5555651.1 hypothetical protein [Blautia sp.]
MRTIIQTLFDMWVDGQPGEMMKKQNEQKELLYRKYRTLRSKLPPELVEELDTLMNSQMELFPVELEESFSEGFKTGVKLMCEVFKEDNLPPIEDFNKRL